MAKIEGEKIYLLEERANLIRELSKRGFNQADIARIFNLDRSMITRIKKLMPRKL